MDPDTIDAPTRRMMTSLVIGAFRDALAFNFGGMTPDIERFVLVWEGKVESEPMRGFLGLDQDGDLMDFGEVHSLLVEMAGHCGESLVERIQELAAAATEHGDGEGDA